jgi:cytoskeletal protein CcmA (bactofilin family)
MQKQNNYDTIDGHRVPQTYINEDYELKGIHEGTINVEAGKFKLRGTLQGTLVINTIETVEISGTQQGTVQMSRGSNVIVSGSIQGTTNVSPGATLIIESTGKLSGTLTNNGTVILRGVFGGAQSGSGNLVLEGEGYIKQPTIKNGISYYEW